jgi:hypothetical protein
MYVLFKISHNLGTWEPFDKMVSEWTHPLNKWRFKVDYRTFVLNEYVTDRVMKSHLLHESPQIQHFHEFMFETANKILNKNRKKLELLERKSMRNGIYLKKNI